MDPNGLNGPSGQTGGQADRRTGGRVGGWADGRTGEREQTDRQTGEQADGLAGHQRSGAVDFRKDVAKARMHEGCGLR